MLMVYDGIIDICDTCSSEKAEYGKKGFNDGFKWIDSLNQLLLYTFEK